MSAPDPQATQVVASFTPDRPKICQRCGLPNEELTYIHPRDTQQEGRWVCPTCYDYYTQKRSSTLIRSSAHQVIAPLSQDHKSKVHKQIAKSQRGNTDVPVVRMARGSMGPPLGLPRNPGFGSFAGWAPPGAAEVDRRLMPMYNQSHAPSSSAPKASSSAPYYAGGSGYSLAHLGYEADKEVRAKQAYAAHGGFSVIIEACASYMTDGSRTIRQFGNALEVIDNVPVHIGEEMLKKMCHTALLPSWSLWTNDYPLAVTDFQLRDDKWVPIKAREPDVDAIAAKFYVASKKPGGAAQFRSKKIILHCHIPNSIVKEVLRLKEAAEEQREYDELIASRQTDINSYDSNASYFDPSFNTFGSSAGELTGKKSKAPKSKGPKGKGKGKATHLEQSTSDEYNLVSASFSTKHDASESATATESITKAHLFLTSGSSQWTGRTTPPLPSELQTRNTSTPPSTPPRAAKKQRVIQSPGSPVWSRTKMVKVLSVQTHPSKVEVHSLFQNKVIPMVVYFMKTFMKLGDLEVTTTDWTTFCLGPQPVTVILDQDPKGRMLGAFKVANLGTTNPAIFDVPEICAKQTYYATRALTVVGTPATTQHVLHDAQRKTALHGDSLFGLGAGVYDFIRRFIREHGDPPFPIPQMRFVKAALATTNINGKPDLFLLEERIDPLVEGKFWKFMNNRSAVPIVYQDAEDCERAEFLSFTQHVQYWCTHKMVFVSDYQGGSTLLTDPQIMSSPNLVVGDRGLFADGNVESGFESFEPDHVCNKFCKFFKLRRDYSQWSQAEESVSSDMDISTIA